MTPRKSPDIEPEEKESKRPYRLTKEEREVVITKTEAENVWSIYTSSLPVMRRLDKWARCTDIVRMNNQVIAREYEVPKACVSIHRPRKVTDAQRQRGLKLSMERKESNG